jgi:hypothetical protein
MYMAAVFLCALDLGLALTIFAAEMADRRLESPEWDNWLDDDAD